MRVFTKVIESDFLSSVERFLYVLSLGEKSEEVMSLRITITSSDLLCSLISCSGV